MTTDWVEARRLEELVARPQLPGYAREAMREAAALIRVLDEELYVRGEIIGRLHAGLPHPGPGAPLAEIRRAYHRDLKRVRVERPAAQASRVVKPKSRLRAVVDVKFVPRQPMEHAASFFLIGECGHVLAVHRWRGLTEASLEAHKTAHVGRGRKRCTRCVQEES